MREKTASIAGLRGLFIPIITLKLKGTVKKRMKIKATLLIPAIFIFLVFSFVTASANPNMTHSAGQVYAPSASPVIDGNITSNEGWSEKKYIYKDNLATFGNTHDIKMSCYAYFSWDKNGLYYAADITDPTFVASTGADTTDNVENDFNIHKSMNVYGYNGDIFTFTADPLSVFMDAGFIANTDYTTWYSVGISPDNICKVYRGHFLSGDITGEVKVAGKITAKGWRFEAFLPWEFFVEDVENASYGELAVTKEALSAPDAYYRCEIIYLDRYYDEEAERTSTWQRYATCAYKIPDGTYGYMTSGVCIKSYGLYISLLGNNQIIPKTTDGLPNTNIGSASAQDNLNNSEDSIMQDSASPQTGDTLPLILFFFSLSLLMLSLKIKIYHKK